MVHKDLHERFCCFLVIEDVTHTCEHRVVSGAVGDNHPETTDDKWSNRIEVFAVQQVDKRKPVDHRTHYCRYLVSRGVHVYVGERSVGIVMVEFKIWRTLRRIDECSMCDNSSSRSHNTLQARFRETLPDYIEYTFIQLERFVRSVENEVIEIRRLTNKLFNIQRLEIRILSIRQSKRLADDRKGRSKEGRLVWTIRRKNGGDDSDHISQKPHNNTCRHDPSDDRVQIPREVTETKEEQDNGELQQKGKDGCDLVDPPCFHTLASKVPDSGAFLCVYASWGCKFVQPLLDEDSY